MGVSHHAWLANHITLQVGVCCPPTLIYLAFILLLYSSLCYYSVYNRNFIKSLSELLLLSLFVATCCTILLFFYPKLTKSSCIETFLVHFYLNLEIFSTYCQTVASLKTCWMINMFQMVSLLDTGCPWDTGHTGGVRLRMCPVKCRWQLTCPVSGDQCHQCLVTPGPGNYVELFIQGILTG